MANTEQELNTPIVNGQVIFFSGSGNIVADPLFEEGGFRWTQNFIDFGVPGDYFLQQTGASISPAVNAGQMTVSFAGLENRSTTTDYVSDTFDVDLGFHYRDP